MRPVRERSSLHAATLFLEFPEPLLESFALSPGQQVNIRSVSHSVQIWWYTQEACSDRLWHHCRLIVPDPAGRSD